MKPDYVKYIRGCESVSTNQKNRARQAFLRNFTSLVERRIIIFENGSVFAREKYQDLINSVNEKLNIIIQEINLKVGERQIPYITLVAKVGSDVSNKARIYVHNNDTDDAFEEAIKDSIAENKDEISHIVDFLKAEGYKEIVISPIECDAEIVISRQYLECAIVDILLDISMFNSYSFLRNLSIEGKKLFSRQKNNFYNEHPDCFYDCSSEKDLYYSLAFSARVSKTEIDIDKYVNLWNSFVKQFYPREVHEEIPIKKQLKYHVDYNELPTNLPICARNSKKGAYLLLRTNKDRTEAIHPMLCSFFGIKEYEKGKIKIVPIEDFNLYKKLLENLDVSAFKVVYPSFSDKSNKNGDDPFVDEPKASSVILSAQSKETILVNPELSNITSRFSIALSFPGEHRNLVEAIADKLSTVFTKERIFYDRYHRWELARPDLDVYLQEIYSSQSELIVIFVCAEYNKRNWCGIEWRSIRTLLNDTSQNKKIMIIKCGPGEVKGLFGTVDGYVDANTVTVDEISKGIIKRYKMLRCED